MDTLTTGTPRQFDFAKGGEHSIDLALSQGMSVMAILDARWGNETLFNDLPFASPIWEHLDLWEDFATQCVNHYRGRIRYWEILNEPPFFWFYPTPAGVRIPDKMSDLKRASIKNYVAFLRASARAIRAADPLAKIVVGSGFYDALFLRGVYEHGGKDLFDIASVHYMPCKHPDDFARSMRSIRGTMREFGDEHKELWDTESGPAGAVIGHAVQTPDEYEGLVNIYRHCFAYEHGLDRYFWFNATGGDHSPESGGVRDKAGNLTPRYNALKVLHEHVGEGALLESRHLNSEVHGYVFDGPRGPVTILWSTAPSTADLGGGAMEATDHQGKTLRLEGNFALSGRPLFIRGNVLSRLDATTSGPRETVTSTLRPAPADSPQARSFRTPARLDLKSAGWAHIPFLARKSDVEIPSTEDHLCKLASPVRAEVQIAHDDENLYLRARTFDESFDPASPYGLVQFTLSNQDPSVLEWSYFYNSYGHWNLFASDHGNKFLRYEHLLIDEYPAGEVKGVAPEVSPMTDGLLFCVAIPWQEIGPVQPGEHNPFFMRFNFTRADHSLSRPPGDRVEEQAHDFSELLICRAPQLSRFVTFD